MAKIQVEKLGKKYGDTCEKCESDKKPIYHLRNRKLDIDIILCPKCIEKFKKAVTDIQIKES